MDENIENIENIETSDQIKEKPISKLKILKIILITILVFILIGLYARFIATTGLQIKEYPIKTTALNPAYDGLKIIHMSDIHYGSTIGIKELKNIVKKINTLKPDIIVFTGDLVDEEKVLETNELNEVIKVLKELDPKIETLAVMGNHDYDNNYFHDITNNLDWHILDNTYEYVFYKTDDPIIFVGLDDLTRGAPDYANAFSYLNEINKDLYTIILAHEPDQVNEISNYNFNLVLSGHSHLGQIRLPLIGAIYTPIGSKKFYDDHYKINNADLYINGGIGTSKIKMRLFNRPSINLYRFYTK